jgi:hypothetical protein
MSSKNTNTNFLRKGSKKEFINLGNVDGAIVNPNGISQKIIMSFMCSKDCFGNVLLPHSDLMIS